MIRAYVAPTDHPALWVEVDAPAGYIKPDRLYIDLTLDESEEMREQMHHAEATARLTCGVGDCRSHQVGGGACLAHGGAS